MAIEEFIEVLKQKLPPVLSCEDLLQLGLVSKPTLCRMRKNGYGPSFIRINTGKIIYLREDVLDWLRQSYKNHKNLKKEATNDNNAGTCPTK